MTNDVASMTPERIAMLRRDGAIDQAISHWDECARCQTEGAHRCDRYVELVKMGERK